MLKWGKGREKEKEASHVNDKLKNFMLALLYN